MKSPSSQEGQEVKKKLITVEIKRALDDWREKKEGAVEVPENLSRWTAFEFHRGHCERALLTDEQMGVELGMLKVRYKHSFFITD